MDINASLWSELTLLLLIVSTASLYVFRYRKGKVTGGQLFINAVLYLILPFGVTYTLYLFFKK